MIKKLLAAWRTRIVAARRACAEETIKLGVVNIDSGPYAVSGAFVNDGAELRGRASTPRAARSGASTNS